MSTFTRWIDGAVQCGDDHVGRRRRRRSVCSVCSGQVPSSVRRRVQKVTLPATKTHGDNGGGGENQTGLGQIRARR